MSLSAGTSTSVTSHNLCEGQYFGLELLTGVAGYNQLWRGPNSFSALNQPTAFTYVTPAQQGTYSYTLSNPSTLTNVDGVTTHGCANSATVNLSVTSANFGGTVDGISCNSVRGWIRNNNCSEQSTYAKITIDDVDSYTVLANQPRTDVSTFAHGFNWRPPAQYAQGTHYIRVTDLQGNEINGGTRQLMGLSAPQPRVSLSAGTSTTLVSTTLCEGQYFGLELISGVTGYNQLWRGPNSFSALNQPTAFTYVTPTQQGIYSYTLTNPSTLTSTDGNTTDGCSNTASVTLNITSANYNGTLDAVSCNAVRGWIVNYNCAQQSPYVRILINGNQVDVVQANQSRGDIRQFVMGQSDPNAFDKYGFNWAPPAQYRLGSYTITVTNMQGTVLNGGQNRLMGMAPPQPRVSVGTSGTTTQATHTLCEGMSFALELIPTAAGYNQLWRGPQSLSALNQRTVLANITPAQQGTYSYTLTNTSTLTNTPGITTDGCSSSAIVTLNVTPQPTGPTVNSVTICSGTSATLTANNCGGTVNWSYNNVTGTTLVTPSLTQTTTYTATCNSASCISSPTVVTVTIGNTPTKPTVTATPGTISSTRSVTLTAMGCTNTVQWQGTTGMGSTTSVVVSVSQTTSFTARCKSAGGCLSDPASVTVSYVTLPTPSVTASTATICGSQTVTLQATGCSEGTTCRWSNGMMGSSITFIPTSTTVYTAKCTLDAAESDPSISVQVTVRPTPEVAGPLNYTTGQTISLTVTPAVANSYSWQGPHGFTDTGASFSIIGATNSSNTGSYTVTANYTGGGCAPFAVIQINVDGPIIQTGAITPASVCPGFILSVPFATTTTTGTFGSGNTFTVQLSDMNGSFANSTTIGAGSSSPINVTIPPNTLVGGNYRIRVVSSNPVLTGGPSPTSLTVSAMPSLTASSNSPAGEVSTGNSLSLNASGTNLTGATYRWSGPASFSSNQASPVVPTATSANSGTYTVTVTTPGGCTAMATTTVVISPTATISGMLSVCAGHSTTLSVSGGSSYRWSTGAQSATMVAAPVSTTIYSVTVTDAAGGTATVSTSVIVSNGPSLTITGKSKLCAGESSTLSAGGGDNYLWSTGTIGGQVVISPTESTTYSVWSMGENGCWAETSIPVQVTSFSMTANSSANGQSLVGQGPGSSLTQGTTVVLSAITDGIDPKDLFYQWSGPNNFTSTGRTPAFVYSSTTQLGVYEVQASSADGCMAGARIGIGTEPECELIVSVYNKTNSSFLTANQHLLIASGCPNGQISWSNGTSGTVSNGTITWADGETGQVESGLVGITLAVNPSQDKNYVAICTLTGGKICTNTSAIKVSSPDCPNVQIQASATTYEQGDIITLTAANCPGTLTWSHGLGSATSIKISPTRDMRVWAQCTEGAKTCYSNSIALTNLSCVKSVYVHSIINNQVTFGYSGCETGSVAWSVVSGTYSSTSVQKQSGILAGLYRVSGVTGNLTVSANCLGTSGTCSPVSRTVTATERTNCAGRFIQEDPTQNRIAGFAVTILSQIYPFTLVDEVNTPFNTTFQTSVGVPDFMKEKVYTATFENGCKNSVKVMPSRPRLEWKENVKNTAGTYSYTGFAGQFTSKTFPDNPNNQVGSEIDAFTLNTYLPYYADANYKIKIRLNACPTIGQLTTARLPATSNSSPIDQLELQHASAVQTPTLYERPFPTETTSYYGSCLIPQPDGSTLIYPAANGKTLQIASNSCLQVGVAQSKVTKGEAVQLKAQGCIGEVTWSLASTSLGTGAMFIHTPLPAATPATLTYLATCSSNTACTQAVSVMVNACTLQLKASKEAAKIGEPVGLTATGCSGGLVQWSSGDVGETITVKPLVSTTYIASCLVNDVSVCQSATSLTVDNAAPLDIYCPNFQLTTQATSITLCSDQRVWVTPYGCPKGSTIRWSDGYLGGYEELRSFTLNQATSLSATCTTPYQISVSAALSFSAAPVQLQVSPTQVYAGYPAMLRASGCYTNTCQEGQYTWYQNGSLVGSGASLTINISQSTTYVVTCSTGSSKSVPVELKENCEISFESPSIVVGNNVTLKAPQNCNVSYGISWYKYNNGVYDKIATNTREIAIKAPTCNTTGGNVATMDYYQVICVKENKIPCKTNFTVNCNPGVYDPIVNTNGPTAPDPCTKYDFMEKGGVKNTARSPGDNEEPAYTYLLYTEWCPGEVKWYDGGRQMNTLSDGPNYSAKTYNYTCQLGNGQECRGSYTIAPPVASVGGGGRLASNQAVSIALGDNCSSQISLATASSAFYSQLLCRLSNLIQTQEDAIAVLSSVQEQLSSTGLVFPTDQTAIIDALVDGQCGLAATLLAATNGNSMFAIGTFNEQINAKFEEIKQAAISAVSKFKGRFIVYTRHFIPEDRDGFYAYRGDGRGFKSIPNEVEYDDNNWETNSSRVIIKNLVDFDTKLIRVARPYCDPTVLLGIIKSAAEPGISTLNYQFLNQYTADFNMSYTASDPLALGIAPVLNFDLNVQVEIIPSLQTLKVSAVLTGDPYPAGEIFIFDKVTKQSWFIDTYSIPQSLEIISSFPENHLPLINSTKYFKINTTGNIVNGLQDGLVISNSVWNSTFTSRNPRR
ncbi:hypothetical protein [Spirosoma profusum]|uniref:hypothetical protein n=1 Tax=Spirosoma profusum TaxID=2771354 RepID=UPI001CC26ED2|nr:hypothetical protein [Spirosoma profusum]